MLTEDEALELLAYLVTSARTQVDEAGEYGPMRLLTAARRLGAAMAAHSSPSTAEFVAGPLTTLPELAVPRSIVRITSPASTGCAVNWRSS